MKFLVSLSLVANGLMAGLILGHTMAQPQEVICRCLHCRRQIGDDTPIDRGPFPTGWVVPEDVKPAKPGTPKPGDAR